MNTNLVFISQITNIVSTPKSSWLISLREFVLRVIRNIRVHLRQKKVRDFTCYSRWQTYCSYRRLLHGESHPFQPRFLWRLSWVISVVHSYESCKFGSPKTMQLLFINSVCAESFAVQTVSGGGGGSAEKIKKYFLRSSSFKLLSQIRGT